MQIGIGLPATIPGTPGNLIVEWAKKAEEASFSSLGIIDRLVYSNFEPLISLTAAAAVTNRIRLVTSILIAPLHNTALLAKQAASIDAISGGRLTLGLAVGGRQDDFKVAQVNFHERGKRFDRQLETMKKIWAGEAQEEGIGPIGPAPVQAGGPEILIGGNTPDAIGRVAKWGNGFINGGGGPDMARKNYDIALASWNEAGRSGKPRFVSGLYFGLGPDAKERGASYLNHYYGFIPQIAQAISSSFPATPEAIKGALAAFEEAGLDEIILWPTIADLDQIERLKELL